MSDELIPVQVSPAVKVINKLILAMIRHGQQRIDLLQSDDPVCFQGTEASYTQFVNRLKVMTNTINPIVSQEDCSGHFQVDVNGKTYDFDVHVAAGDQQVSLELK